MKTFDDAWHCDELPRGAVATIGNYDGIHRGQRAILDRVTERARVLECPAAVVTFAPHPARVLFPERAPRRLTTAEQKERLLAAAGLDLLFVVAFDEEFAETSAREFVERFLYRALALREIYVGSGFVFGKGREGNLELLEELGGTRHPAFGVEEITAGEVPISSTRVREAVATGRIDVAEWLLGRPYEVTGVVAHGAGKGSELGWPTINLAHDNELLPAHGVYVTMVRVESEGMPGLRPAVANVGVRPTIHVHSAPTVECHLLDFEGDLYGHRVSVEFLKRLRGEQAFASVEALRRQIESDVTAARRYFKRTQGHALEVV